MKTETNISQSGKREKILLAMLPYWTPLIPPQGLGCLKRFLSKYGYKVRAFDLNIEENSKNIYNTYFGKLKEWIPERNWGNFYNIGHDVLQDHMMAHSKYEDEDEDEEEYIELVKIIVYKTYYTHLDDSQVKQLNEVLDEFYSWIEKRLTYLLETEQPDVFGLSACKGSIPATLFAFRFVKQKNPKIKTVLGGGAFADSHAVGSPNFEALVKETEEYLDKIIISGQGELILLKYLQGGIPDSKRLLTKEDVDGEVINFEDMDIADLSDFKMEYYPYLAATASSSCPFECSFCNAANFWGKYKKKDPKQVVDEMSRLYKTYGTQLFFMTDSLLNPTVKDIANEFLKRDLCLYYDCYFRVDKPSSNVDNTLLWRRGGLYRVRMGVESGSQKVLDMMNKGITPQQIKQAVSNLAYAGIKTTLYWVIGHPGETEEDFQMTLDLLEELKDDIYQAEPNPFHYHYTGQFSGDQWAEKRMRVYPVSAKDMVVFETWTLDIEPLREECYDRMFRFIEHCKKLGIPNPYTANEIFLADERWKRLHKNAVPSVVEFEKWGRYIDECKNVKKFVAAKNILDNDDDDFDF